jgi:hypothetical protein
MTGVKPKSEFAQPGLLLEVTFELIRQVFVQYVLRRPPLMPTEIGVEIVKKQANKKQGSYA